MLYFITNITDGDDHAWSADPAVLAGGGGWRNFDFSTSSLLGKRACSSSEDFDCSTSSDDVEEVHRHFFPSVDTHDSEEEEEIDDHAEYLLKRAAEFEQAAAILRAQVPQRNKLWMSSVVKRDIGADVGHMLDDIRRFESTSQTRDTTWAKGKDKVSRRRVQNTMGYQIRLDSD
ncbi:hypothetical protein K438DRAFT_1960133 [Mycena galopus ATCC 62051]|nr:hypothetical protein K438DRAFT_1960133 [Mycena galopus ATCC 62051]